MIDGNVEGNARCGICPFWENESCVLARDLRGGCLAWLRYVQESK